jgi:hypothetical protein
MAKIQLEKLKKNTKILMDTEDTVFELTVTGPKSKTVSVHGGTVFIRPTKAIIEEEIEIGKRVKFKYKDKYKWHSVMTSTIISAKIYASDGSWSYEI